MWPKNFLQRSRRSITVLHPWLLSNGQALSWVIYVAVDLFTNMFVFFLCQITWKQSTHFSFAYQESNMSNIRRTAWRNSWNLIGEKQTTIRMTVLLGLNTDSRLHSQGNYESSSHLLDSICKYDRSRKLGWQQEILQPTQTPLTKLCTLFLREKNSLLAYTK